MKIELHEITIRDLYRGYEDNAEEGVVAYNGQLDVRPKYQREFVYDDDKRNAVIESVMKGFPLNVMYWVKRGDGGFELLDGQQRTVSICQYIEGDYSINERYFHTLQKDEQEQILNYKLMIYFCEGTPSETLDWFGIINIAGTKLTNQELLNAIYTGEWLTSAKRYFSKTGCPAYDIAERYVNGKVIRQEVLELALTWIADRDGIIVKQYMADHQQDKNANELWLYFSSVITWVQTIFPNYRKEMKGLPWGIYYNAYKDEQIDTEKINERLDELMQDDEVSKKSGIYIYLLDGKEKHLNLRAFDNSVKRTAYERQKGICKICGKHFDIKQMEADHKIPWSKGGRTDLDNCQMLCLKCNREKSDK